jgi:hypothetical protein
MLESFSLSLFVIYAYWTSLLPPRIIIGIIGLIFVLLYKDFEFDDIIFKFVGKNIFRKPYFNKKILKPWSKKTNDFIYRLFVSAQALLMLFTRDISEDRFISYQKCILIIIIFLYPIILLNIHASKELYQQCRKTMNVMINFYYPKANTVVSSTVVSSTVVPPLDNIKVE